MRVLCAVGIQNGAEMIRRVLSVIGPQHDLYLLHVIDTGPRRMLDEYLRGPGGTRRPPSAQGTNPIDAAEQAAGDAALEEARREAEKAGFQVQTAIERGRPEQMIVQAAAEHGCRLVAIQASEGTQGRPHIGPESVGHTARFVLDHAPCDVLLLREI
jgi:nucleotide-binding universal stress UspA family protein